MKGRVKLLLAFFALDEEDEELTAGELTPYLGGLARDLVVPIARYLETATYVWPSMGVVDDVVEGAFGASDSVSTDGFYAWQTWAGQYVRHYAIALPSEFIDHCRNHNFTPPHVPEDEERAIDRFLRKRLGSLVQRKNELWTAGGPPPADLLIA